MFEELVLKPANVYAPAVVLEVRFYETKFQFFTAKGKRVYRVHTFWRGRGGFTVQRVCVSLNISYGGLSQVYRSDPYFRRAVQKKEV